MNVQPPDRRSALTESDKRYLLSLARETLRVFLGEGRRPVCDEPSPGLMVARATFVTLRRRSTGELRGCRGEIEAKQPIVDAVVETTIASATDDPRFPPVAAGEVEDLHIEISALTPLQQIAPDEVEVGRHGLLLVVRGRRGLLLPQVPVEQGWDRITFLRWVCRKAGVDPEAWRMPDAQLFAFECEVWGEDDAHG